MLTRGQKIQRPYQFHQVTLVVSNDHVLLKISPMKDRVKYAGIGVLFYVQAY